MRKMNIRRARRDDVTAIVTIYSLDEVRGSREIVSVPLPERYFHAFETIDVDPNQPRARSWVPCS